MTVTSAPAELAHPRQPESPPALTKDPAVQPTFPAGPTKLERESQFHLLALVLGELSRRYPTLSVTTIRSLAVDVLCQSLPERLTPSMVARVLEARLSAML